MFSIWLLCLYNKFVQFKIGFYSNTLLVFFSKNRWTWTLFFSLLPKVNIRLWTFGDKWYSYRNIRNPMTNPKYKKSDRFLVQFLTVIRVQKQLKLILQSTARYLMWRVFILKLGNNLMKSKQHKVPPNKKNKLISTYLVFIWTRWFEASTF